MRHAISVVVVLALAACSSLRPLPIKAGETCFSCRQVIVEPKLAAEIIDANGHAYKFRTVECMAKYIASHPGEELAGVWVTDYNSGRFVAAGNATYVRGVIDEARMERNYFAFRSAPDAAKFAQDRASTAVDWAAVMRRVSGD
jgi:hypothetical protein